MENAPASARVPRGSELDALPGLCLYTGDFLLAALKSFREGYTGCTLVAENIVIVGGCGHVGLPLGMVLANLGTLQVALLYIDPGKVEQVNAGRMPFRERGADELLRKVVGKTLTATLDTSVLNSADVVITVVGTPVDEHLSPTVKKLYENIDALLEEMKIDSLLILRSTV